MVLRVCLMLVLLMRIRMCLFVVCEGSREDLSADEMGLLLLDHRLRNCAVGNLPLWCMRLRTEASKAGYQLVVLLCSREYSLEEPLELMSDCFALCWSIPCLDLQGSIYLSVQSPFDSLEHDY